LIEHDLFGKPVSTFPDHALASPSAPVQETAESAAELMYSLKPYKRCFGGVLPRN
jgi:hypothetical protein